MSDSAPRARPFTRAPRPRFTMREMLISLTRNKFLAVTAFLIPTALGILAGQFARDSFIAQARLLVLHSSDYVFHPGSRETGNAITLDRNEIIQGELQILGSPNLVMEALRDLGPRTVYPGLPDGPDLLQTGVTRFLNDLSATNVPQSNVIQLSLRNPDRAIAIRALDVLITHYISYRDRVFNKAVPVRIEEIRAQFATRLQAAEDEFIRFAVAHGVGDVDEQTGLLLRQQNANMDGLRAVDQQISDVEAQRIALRRALEVVPPTVRIFAESDRSQQSKALTDALVQLQNQRHDMAAVDRLIASLKAQIAATPSREQGTERIGRNELYDRLQQQEISLGAQIAGMTAKRQQLVQQSLEIRARSNELFALTQRYRELQRTRDVLDQSYRRIAQNSEETGLSTELERARGANVRVVQPPGAPLTGRSLRVPVMVAGAVFGFLLAVALLALRVATRRVFVTAADVERQLGLPVLLQVPYRTRSSRSNDHERGVLSADASA